MKTAMGEQLNLALALEGRGNAAPGNRDLVAIAGALAALPDPRIDQSFMLALEARLMTEGLETAPARHLQVVSAEPAFPQTSADELVRRAPVIQMPRRHAVVRRSVAAGLAAAMLGAFPLVAAAQSLPGSPFYGLKVTMEHAQIAMFGGAISDGFTHAHLAQERIDEAAQITAMGADQSLIAATLRAADYELKAAQALIMDNTTDPATLNKFAGIAAESERQMAAMTGMTGGAERARTGAMTTTKSIQSDIADALGLSVDVVAPVATVTAGTPTITGSDSTGSTSSGTSSTKTSTGGTDTTKPGSDTPKAGDGSAIDGPTAGCEVFGAKQFGDAFTLITRVTCE